jgi:hypothetical protein
MFFQLLFIHLFRPFLKSAQPNGPLPPSVQPRRICTQSAATISKILRIYKRTHGLRQICNMVVYMAHSACTIHLLNLPDEDARRDIVHSVKALEEISESWLSARRTLLILSKQAQKWKINVPTDAAAVLSRTEEKYGGTFSPQPTVEDAGLSAQLTPSSTSSGISPLSPLGNPTLSQLAMLNNTAALRAKTSSNSPGIGPSMSSKFGPPTMSPAGLPAADMRLPQSAGMLPTDIPQTSPAAMLVGSYPSYPDSKDWLLKDQSAMFDQWTGSADASSIGSAMTVESTQAQAKAQWDAAMMGMSGETADEGGRRESTTESSEFPEDSHMYGLEYLDFTSDSVYGYQHGGGGL